MATKENKMPANVEACGYAADRSAPVLLSLWFKHLRKKTVLEYGSGSGTFLRLLRSIANQAYGIDLSPTGFQKDVFKCDVFDHIERQKVTSGRNPDTIICCEVIEHLSEDQMRLIFDCAFCDLKDNGVFLLTTPHNEKIEMGIVECPNCNCEFHRMGHLRVMRVDDVVRQLQSAGFEDIKVDLIPLGLLSIFPKVFWRLVSFWGKKLEEKLGCIYTVNMLISAKKQAING